MSFSQFVSHSQSSNCIHSIFDRLEVYEGKHHLYSSDSASNSTKILAASVGDLLKANKKVLLYINPASDSSSLLLQILASLTNLSVQDLKNPNFRNKESTQEKIKEIEKKYELFFKTELLASSAIQDNLMKTFSQHQAYDIVFISDLNDFASGINNELGFSRAMNIAISSFNNLATTYNLPIISFTFGASDEAGYLKNKDSNLVVFRTCSESNWLIAQDEFKQFNLKFKENLEYMIAFDKKCASNKEERIVIGPNSGISAQAITFILKKLGYEVQELWKDKNASPTSHIAIDKNNNRIAIMMDGAKKITTNHINIISQEMFKQKCIKGILYSNANLISSSLYQVAKHSKIELIDAEDFKKIMIRCVSHDNQEVKNLLLKELEQHKNDLDEEFKKGEDKNFDKIKTINTRIKLCLDSLIKNTKT